MNGTPDISFDSYNMNYGSVTLNTSNLSSAMLDNANLGSTALDNIHLGSATFDHVNLGSMTFNNANLGSIPLDNSNLGSTLLNNANLGSVGLDLRNSVQNLQIPPARVLILDPVVKSITGNPSTTSTSTTTTTTNTGSTTTQLTSTSTTTNTAFSERLAQQKEAMLAEQQAAQEVKIDNMRMEKTNKYVTSITGGMQIV